MSELIEELRAATGHLHKEAEGMLLPDLQTIDKEEYSFFLRTNLAFHQAYEPAVARARFTDQQEWKRFDRSRLDKLSLDASQLNIHIRERSEMFVDWSEHKLLGAAYVSEGSTLGGQVILKTLKKKPFFEEASCGRFLTGVGADTGKAWKSFLILLEREGQHDPKAVVDGAVEAFGFFIQLSKAERARASVD